MDPWRREPMDEGMHAKECDRRSHWRLLKKDTQKGSNWIEMKEEKKMNKKLII